MAIKRGSKVDSSYSASSMTDLMFLLLIFMIIATTLINPNAVKLMLPKSANQLKDKALTTELENVGSRQGIERALQTRLAGQEEPTISLHADKTVEWDEIVQVMNIAKDNGYKLIAATQP